jgi:hypothetical protein
MFLAAKNQHLKEITMTHAPNESPTDKEAQIGTKRFSIRKILRRVILAALAIVIINTVIHANQNFMNRFKEGFYYEQYSNGKDAQAALLELHPIGSDVKELRKTLENAGAQNTIYFSHILYAYIQNTQSKFFKSFWGVAINRGNESDTKVRDISVNRSGRFK